jgi:hypothetical protein
MCAPDTFPLVGGQAALELVLAALLHAVPSESAVAAVAASARSLTLISGSPII